MTRYQLMTHSGLPKAPAHLIIQVAYNVPIPKPQRSLNLVFLRPDPKGSPSSTKIADTVTIL